MFGCLRDVVVILTLRGVVVLIVICSRAELLPLLLEPLPPDVFSSAGQQRRKRRVSIRKHPNISKSQKCIVANVGDQGENEVKLNQKGIRREIIFLLFGLLPHDGQDRLYRENLPSH